MMAWQNSCIEEPRDIASEVNIAMEDVENDIKSLEHASKPESLDVKV